MNSCVILAALVVVSAGPWATAKDVFHEMRNGSAREGAGEETKRKLSGDAGLAVVEGLGQVASKARAWGQWLRRVLKALRKWWHSHPVEVKLGKCFAKYLGMKPGGRGEFDKAGGSEAYSRVTEHLNTSEPPRVQQETIGRRNGDDRKGDSKHIVDGLWSNLVSSAHELMGALNTRFLCYRKAVLGNELAVCIWEYVLKKFWTWVDSAPDPRFGFR